MKFHKLESAARKAKAVAQATERTFKTAVQKVKGLEKEARLAKLKLKQAKKESKKAAKAARVGRDDADETRRVAAKAAARAAKVHAKVVKARKTLAARKDKEAASPRKDLPKPSARAIITLNRKRDDQAPPRSHHKVAAQGKAHGAPKAPVMKVASAEAKRAPAAKRISATVKPPAQAAPQAPITATGRPETDFDAEWTEADLKEIDSEL